MRSLRFHTRNHVESTKNRLHRDRDAMSLDERLGDDPLAYRSRSQLVSKHRVYLIIHERSIGHSMCLFATRTYALPVNHRSTENCNNVQHDYFSLAGQQ